MQAERLAPITMAKARWILGSFVYPRLGRGPSLRSRPRRCWPCAADREPWDERDRAPGIAALRADLPVCHGDGSRDAGHYFRLAGRPGAGGGRDRAAITEPAKIGALLHAIDDYIGHPTTLIALKLSPLVFLRPSELRAAEWSEINLQGAEWRVPAARMKMRERHIVPLAFQAVGILQDLRSVTGKGRYLLPSLRTSDRPMSVNTVNAALRRLGYARDEMTGHGFRAMACTCLNELGWHPDVIELQMAHGGRNKVRAAYNQAERLAERTKMMQAWADYLDRLRAGGGEIVATDAAPPVPSSDAVHQSSKRKKSHSVPTAQLELGLGIKSCGGVLSLDEI